MEIVEPSIDNVWGNRSEMNVTLDLTSPLWHLLSVKDDLLVAAYHTQDILTLRELYHNLKTTLIISQKVHAFRRSNLFQDIFRYRWW